MEQRQQKLREWILKQKYFFLAPEYDGMTAWELAGIILRESGDTKFVYTNVGTRKETDFQENE